MRWAAANCLGSVVTRGTVEATKDLLISNTNEVQEIVSSESLTDKHKITNWETLKHIEVVMQLLATMRHEIAKRMFSHDHSKLRSPELEMFETFTDDLKTISYGSGEYKKRHQEMLKSALKHHYENNRHHPEFFENGVSAMNLVDLIEMLCDWKASTLRYADGNILQSIEINAKRFNLSPDLVQILQNTVPLLVSAYNPFSQKHLSSYWSCSVCEAKRLDGNFCPICSTQKK